MKADSLLLPYESIAEDDHPLFDELCSACRTGDIKRIKYLVEVEEVPLNRRDKWDSTPLYYSSLCGQVETAKYLLSVGARCDPTTFEGERCLYGALSDEMRNLLKSHRLKKALDITADFAIFMQSLFSDPEDRYSDVVFKLPSYFIPGTSQIPTVHAHRCIVAARSPFLAKQLAGKWAGTAAIPIKHYRVHPVTLRAVMLWIYAGQVSPNLSHDQLQDLDFICRQWRLYHLQSQIQPLLLSTSPDQPTEDGLSHLLPGSLQITRDMGITKKTKARQASALTIKNSTSIPSEGAVVSLDSGSVKRDLSVLVNILMGPIGKLWSDHHFKGRLVPDSDVDNEEWLLIRASHPDIAVNVAGVYFPCHRAFLTRSEYFKGLLMGNFSEAVTVLRVGQGISIGVLSLSLIDDVEVFKCVLEFLYTHETSNLRKRIALKVMEAADFLLLPRLKTLAVNHLISFTKGSKDHHYLTEIPPELEYNEEGEIVFQNWKANRLREDDGMSGITEANHHVDSYNRDSDREDDDSNDEEEKDPAEFEETNDILPTPDLLLRASWSMNLPRLEQHLTRYYAERLSYTLCRSRTFRSLVKDSSESVKNREETDTVIFVDDLRWWVGKIHGFDAGPMDDVGVPGRFIVGEDVEMRRRAYVWKIGLLDAVLAGLEIMA
ncbi:Ankyrin repeat and BTB/POZ domain-containing protein 1 [Dinochytrium kinnereticum]|nr:Ankyrin repeat and BTB/POZ domain-containing protein 1 [Dinochytrium kinnereticum]